jgi:adenylyltransferase/sulfurtransferase
MEQLQRYSRQIILPNVGAKGQKKLLNSKVLVLGAGGLGSPAAYYLTAAGVGEVGIIDMDVVDISNLQRQILHFTEDIGKPKTVSAIEKLEALNPDVIITPIQERITRENVCQIIDKFDFILEGSDNFATKFLINDACVSLGKPFTIAGVLRFEGQMMTVVPGNSNCYRCVFPEPPPPGTVPSCQEAGVFGTVTGLFGSLQASEAIKYLLGIGELLIGRMLIFDVLSMFMTIAQTGKDKSCKACGESPIDLLKNYEYESYDMCELSNS